MDEDKSAAGQMGNHELVLTHGGARDKAQVHYVASEEVVHPNEQTQPFTDDHSVPSVRADLALTPGGYRSRSLVHRVGPEHIVRSSPPATHIVERQTQRLLRDIPPLSPQDVRKTLVYYRNQQSRMRYDEYRRKGYRRLLDLSSPKCTVTRLLDSDMKVRPLTNGPTDGSTF